MCILYRVVCAVRDHLALVLLCEKGVSCCASPTLVDFCPRMGQRLRTLYAGEETGEW